MSVFLERLPPLRGAVTPGVVGRLFRRLSAVGRRLDAEHVTPGTLVAARKTQRWLHFDLWGGITVCRGETRPFKAGEIATGRIVHSTRMEGDATADLELIGWSVLCPDLHQVGVVSVTLTFERDTGGGFATLDAVVVPAGLDDVDAYSRILAAPFPLPLTNAVERLRVRMSAVTLDAPPPPGVVVLYTQTAAVFSIGFHFRRRPV